MRRPRFRISSVAVIEEGFDLLLQAPASALLRYYVGSVPFVLGGCFFVLDLARNPTGAPRSGLWALAMTALYLWMKLWQASFTGLLRRELGDVSEDRPPRWARWSAAADRLGWEAFAPWVLVFAAVAAVPFGWVYAFYQSLAVTGDASHAWAQSKAWPRQNHAILAALGLFAIFVALNVLATIFTLPYLASSLLGLEIQTLFAGGNLAVVTIGATYLLVGPLAKATYVLRGFYSDSRSSGEDLKSRIRALTSRAAVLLLLAALSAAAPAVADQASTQPRPIDPVELDTALEHELSGADYDWSRATAGPEADLGFLARLMLSASRGLQALSEWLDGLVRQILEWLREEESSPTDSSSPTRVSSPRVVLLLACGLLLGALIYLITRRRPGPAAETGVAGAALEIEQALAGDDSAADRMPFDRWLETAHELMAGGDPRRAARAVYLATLSFMAHSNLVLLARHKSNRDYRTELAVKSRRWPELLPAFSDSVRVVERVWYGRHPRWA